LYIFINLKNINNIIIYINNDDRLKEIDYFKVFYRMLCKFFMNKLGIFYGLYIYIYTYIYIYI